MLSRTAPVMLGCFGSRRSFAYPWAKTWQELMEVTTKSVHFTLQACHNWLRTLFDDIQYMHTYARLCDSITEAFPQPVARPTFLQWS
jgi:hypothetical protein